MRLIDADALLNAMYTNINDAPLYIQATVAQTIDCSPTVDAVPVVRCSECKHWQRHTEVNRDYGPCRRYGSTMRFDDFCSCGERRVDHEA